MRRVQWRGTRPPNARQFERVFDAVDDRLNSIETVHATELADGRVLFHFSTAHSGHLWIDADVSAAQAEHRLAGAFKVIVADADELRSTLQRHYADAVAFAPHER